MSNAATAMLSSDDNGIQLLTSLLSEDPEAIGSFLASPVKLNETHIYPIENYGSAMAPFYSTLAIWVGAVVMAAMLKVNVSDNLKHKLNNPKEHQLYIGRILLLLCIGFLQSTLICLGDLYFLGIQCEHPVLFVLAGCFSSLVYVNIIYALTVSFGDIGKAIAVVLMVMQVAGSGGTFPIQCAPEFFRKVYPLLPFVHSMNAMRECIASFYNMNYWIELGKLALFLIPALLLGLILRKPVIKLNDAFTEKLQPLYNQIYSQNITTMKEAAISYFTTDRLPSKVGESVTITLKEMQDKKLVLDLIDSNNKKCDVEKSSVKVEKLDNEYLMTVKLECSDASNYIEVHLGCYDYCKASGVCEKKETPVIKPTNPTKPVISEKKYQYEYEKITDGKWGDFGEWSQWSKDTITKTEYRNVETKEITEKTGTLVDVIDAKKDVKTTYSCPSGYTLNGTKCKKTTTDTKNATASTKTTYSCPSGYTLNGTKCSKKTTATKNATANKKTTYSCPSGYTLNGTKCSKKTTDTKTATKNEKVTYSCSNKDYTLNGDKCTKTVDVYTKYTYYRYQEKKCNTSCFLY